MNCISTLDLLFNNFWLATISIEDARPIYQEHPDFYKCASPGAARAKNAVKPMNIVTADSYVLEALNEAVSDSHLTSRAKIVLRKSPRK